VATGKEKKEDFNLSCSTIPCLGPTAASERRSALQRLAAGPREWLNVCEPVSWRSATP